MRVFLSNIMIRAKKKKKGFAECLMTAFYKDASVEDDETVCSVTYCSVIHTFRGCGCFYHQRIIMTDCGLHKNRHFNAVIISRYWLMRF